VGQELLTVDETHHTSSIDHSNCNNGYMTVLTVLQVEIVPLMPNIDISGLTAGIERQRSCKLFMKLITHTI
jgi:hypothetical protein